MDIVTKVEDAQFLKTASVFSVDIETDTTPPTEDWATRKYGLSYVAPITHVSFYAPGHPAVVFNQPLPADFFREVLDRSGYTLIGHNVAFDVRSLCGHYGILLPKGVKVWDTQVVALRTLLAEPDKREASLFEQVNRYAWQNIFTGTEEDRAFYNAMKSFRANFAAIHDAIQDEKHPHHTLLLAYGADTQEIINKYVIMDTVLTFFLYEFQKEFIEHLAVEDVKLQGRNIPRHDGIKDLIEWEQKISWTGCRQAAMGLPLDEKFLRLRREEYTKKLLQAYADMNQTPDPTDSIYPEFERDFAWMIWYQRVLSAAAGETYSALKAPFLNVLGEDRHPDEKKFLLQYVTKNKHWLDALANLNPHTKYNKTSIQKALPRMGEPPSFDLDKLIEWVRAGCFPDMELAEGRYRAMLKVTWTLTKYASAHDLNVQEALSKRSFRYYYLFCMCGVKLPESQDIKFNPFLVTKRFMKLVAEQGALIRPQIQYDVYDDSGEDEDDVQDEIVHEGQLNLRLLAITSNTLSCGKKSVDYYLPKPKIEVNGEDVDNPEFLDHPARHYRIAIEMEAYIQRIDEFLAHAERDGKIHSVISRLTRTGRYSSTTPNLQNLNMKVCAGWLYAPDGWWLVELDYANAENKTGAMVSGDNNFAMATESGDFHSNQAAIYFAEQWNKALENDDRDTMSMLRNMGKPITFGDAYGMGIEKMAASIKRPPEEARIIKQNKERRYPKVTLRKRESADRTQDRLNKGYYPSFTTLWTNNRVSVQSFRDDSGKLKSVGYTAWNYIQQGGVAEMIARATVEIMEWLIDHNKLTYVALNVHDSLIVAVKIEEYESVVPEIIKIMCRQMPENYCRRTTPKIHFVSEVGPENAKKWGYRHGCDYPFSLDHFVNQWGVHLLPEKELQKEIKKREAPTWLGPEHLGWTLEKEMQELAQ